MSTSSEVEGAGHRPAAGEPLPADSRRLRSGLARLATKAALLAVASLLLGGLTSLAQAVLPDVLRPLANSASGWTVPTAVLVWALREGAGASAVLGALSFECLVTGYVLASQLRGFPDSETLFLLIGLVGGPIVGAAAARLHRRGWPAAIGAGVLSGVLLGDAGWGLAVIAGTTGWLYWAIVGVLGVGLLAAPVVRGVPRWRQAVLAVAAALVVAAAFLGVYAVLS